MLERLAALEERYNEVMRLMADPDVIADLPRYTELNREFHHLEPIVTAAREYRDVLVSLEEVQEIIADGDDADLVELAEAEVGTLEAQSVELEEQLRELLIPRDPNDDRNTILEFRGGTGGDEATLFAGDLFRMYSRYAENNGWSVETISSSP